MSFKAAIYLIVFCFPLVLFGQNNESLNQELDQIKELATQDLNAAISQAQTGLENAENEESINRYGKLLADFYFEQARYDAADSLYKLVYPWHKSSPSISTLEIYAHWGRILQTTGSLSEGLTLMGESEELIASNPNLLADREQKLLVARIQRITGILYAMQIGLDEQGTFHQASAERYFRQSYQLFAEAGDRVMEGLALFNIGNVQASEDSTIYYWQKALDHFDEYGISKQKFNVYQNLAILYIDKGEFPKALEYLIETKKYMPENPDPYDQALYEIKLGATYANLSRLSEAATHLERGLKIGVDFGMMSIQGEAYELLIGTYSQQNRFKDAFETYIKYDTLNVKFQQIETERIFRETEARFKTKEQQDQIQILQQEEALNQARINRQRLIIAIIVVILLLIGALGFLFWKQSKSREMLNRQLQKLDQARKRFLVNISHELRTPVTLIHAPLQDAMSSLEKDDISRAKSDLQKISNNTRKLLQLTEEVLDISRLDEGALQFEPEPTDLNKFLNRVFFAFESLAIRNHIHWEIDVSKVEGFYEIDPKKLERILNNLFSNAIKHTPNKGTVSFDASLDNTNLHLTITDTGRGIPVEALPRIFDRYYQATENDKAMGGLGVGLSLVKELIEFMGGTIEAKSQLQKGTQFELSIPVKKTHAIPIDDETSESFELSVESRPSIDLSDKEASHILVVEDNPEMSDFIQQLLSDHYRVTLAENGKEGLERLKSGRFDLITADVMMPEMDGISFVKEIKEHHDWRNISVIMITALSEEADKIAGLRLGIDDYIPKPFSANELKARVANLLHNASSRIEASKENGEEIVGNEKQLLDDALKKVEEHLGDNSFSVTELSNHLNLSERQANRVLKKITGLSCLQFIREIRLQRAYRLLESHKYQTIAEVAYAVGFENASYFTRIFNDRFGKKPSEML